jgi:hypothetical protein
MKDIEENMRDLEDNKSVSTRHLYGKYGGKDKEFIMKIWGKKYEELREIGEAT